ncbi:MAG TPA: hypothetical protein VF142_20685 [Longimicrobium sp.]
MALRLMNTGKHPLTVDLRGGEAVVLAPGETSPPLREEGLYGHPHLSAWVAAGVVQRRPARMDDVLEHEAVLGLPAPLVVDGEDDGADAAAAEAGTAASADAGTKEGGAADGGEPAVDFVPDERLIAGVDAPPQTGRKGGRGSRKSR